MGVFFTSPITLKDNKGRHLDIKAEILLDNRTSDIHVDVEGVLLDEKEYISLSLSLLSQDTSKIPTKVISKKPKIPFFFTLT